MIHGGLSIRQPCFRLTQEESMDVISKFAEQVLISIAPLIAVPLFIWLITMAMQA